MLKLSLSGNTGSVIKHTVRVNLDSVQIRGIFIAQEEVSVVWTKSP